MFREGQRDLEGISGQSSEVLPTVCLHHPSVSLCSTRGKSLVRKGTVIQPLCMTCLWQMDDPSVGPKIPQALEKILQLKESRQEEMNSQQGECVGGS